MKPQFEKTIGVYVDDGAYLMLERNEFSKMISDMMIRILSEILENGVVGNKEILLREGESVGIIVRTLSSKKEIVFTDLKRYYSPEQAKSMVRIISQPLIREIPYSLHNLIADMTQRLIQPNLTLNRNETEERRKKAADAVKPILYKIKAGEMIIREGERVSEGHLRKLRALRSQTVGKNTLARNMGRS
ncbi:MAG: hypothetical protein HC887_01620 [Desulfobacteraceae bacterium]|nr:hypothetical protein [Desulfobacteraceae bacterium]